MDTLTILVVALLSIIRLGYLVWRWWWGTNSDSTLYLNLDTSGTALPSESLQDRMRREKTDVHRRASQLRFYQEMTAFQAARQMQEVARRYSNDQAT